MAEKKKAKRIERRGAKPRTNVERYAIDNSIVRKQRGEPEADVLATALAQPHRRAFDDRRNPLAGFASGRLLLYGSITKAQFQALERYARLSLRYMRDVLGQSIHFARINIEPAPDKRSDDAWLKGRSHPSSEENDIWRLKDDHSAALCAIQDAGDFALSMRVLFAVGVMDREPGNDLEMGALRCALNTLVRLWRIGE